MSVHITYQNAGHSVEFEDLFPESRYTAIGIAEGQEVSPSTVSESQVKTACAQYFEVGLGEFEAHYVEINSSTGNITVRPDASFGG